MPWLLIAGMCCQKNLVCIVLRRTHSLLICSSLAILLFSTCMEMQVPGEQYSFLPVSKCFLWTLGKTARIPDFFIMMCFLSLSSYSLVVQCTCMELVLTDLLRLSSSRSKWNIGQRVVYIWHDRWQYLSRHSGPHPSSPNLLLAYPAMSSLVFQPSSCHLLGSIPQPD